MNSNTENIDLFDAYHNDELEASAKSEFELRLEQDENFKLSYSLYLQTVEAIELTALKEEVKSIIQSQNRNAGYQIYYRIAAIILFVFLVGIIWFITKPIDTEDIYSEFYLPFPAEQQVRGAPGATENGMQYYRGGNYTKALEYFIENEDGPSDQMSLYIANCYLQLNEPDLAISSLEPSLSSQSNTIKQHAEWYLLLAHLKLEKLENVKTLAKQMENDHLYSSNAREILELISD